MNALAILSIALTAFVPDRPAPLPMTPAAKDELSKLDGTWAVVSYDYDGGSLPLDQIATYPKLIMKGGKYRWSNSEEGGWMTIDAGKTPKTVDYRQGGQNGPLHLGIYDLNGDVFRDCIAPPGRPRPADFTVPPGSGRTLFVYRRVKD